MAKTDYEVLGLSFEHGLYEGEEASTLSPGFAQALENWVPEPTGGIRARVGWRRANSGGAPGTTKSTGLGYIASPQQRILQAVRSGASETTVYSINRGSLVAGSWASRDIVSTSDGSAHTDFALGLGYAYYSNLGFGAIHRWDGTGASSAVADSPAGARTLAFHKSRIFAGQGTTLWYSEINDGGTWPAENFIQIGADDGEPIECLEVFSDQLLIGKENSTWLLTGAGADTFALHFLSSLGAAPGRTIVRTPYGAVIAGKTYVSLFSGSEPIPISEAVERSYGMTGSYMTAAYIDKTCYIVDAGAETYWAYDTDRKVWWHESIQEAPNNLMVVSNELFAGPKSSMVPMFYRTIPALTRDKDEGIAETFQATTPELWLGEASSATTLKHLFARYRQRGGNAGQTPVTITPTLDAVEYPPEDIETERVAGTYRVRKDFGATGFSISLDLSQELEASEAAVMDIEGIELHLLPGESR